jgi:hypothetical protein
MHFKQVVIVFLVSTAIVFVSIITTGIMGNLFHGAEWVVAFGLPSIPAGVAATFSGTFLFLMILMDDTE